jgi:hypothetical protein
LTGLLVEDVLALALDCFELEVSNHGRALCVAVAGSGTGVLEITVLDERRGGTSLASGVTDAVDSPGLRESFCTSIFVCIIGFVTVCCRCGKAFGRVPPVFFGISVALIDIAGERVGVDTSLLTRV